MQYKIFGCKVNKYYLNKRINYFQQNNLDEDNVFLIASCEVTDRAKSKRIKEVVNQIKKGKKVYITGCGVLKNGKIIESDSFYELYPELSSYSESIFLLGEDPDNVEMLNSGNVEIPKDRNENIEKGRSNNLNKTFTSLNLGISKSLSQIKELYTKKFIVIQNGCDNFCSFCLTVLKRGKSRSIDMQEIISEINEFEKNGGKEIVITGINLASWGADDTKKPEESKFAELLKNILNLTTIPRIRISSLGPEFLDDRFFEIIKDKRFLPHFHISVQSFSDKVLKSMNRNYNSKKLEEIIKKFGELERDDIDKLSLGADLIVGFPGETQEDFQKTLESVEKFEINKLHVFPFSAHIKGESVPAGKYPNQVDRETKKEREKQLIELGDQIRKNFVKKNIGKSFSVLLEERKDGKQRGRTENYIQIETDKNYKRGKIIQHKL